MPQNTDKPTLGQNEVNRLFDPGKAVGGCDGYFEPTNLQPHGAMREGKTQQDLMSREERPRYKAWRKRLGYDG